MNIPIIILERKVFISMFMMRVYFYVFIHILYKIRFIQISSNLLDSRRLSGGCPFSLP